MFVVAGGGGGTRRHVYATAAFAIFSGGGWFDNVKLYRKDAITADGDTIFYQLAKILFILSMAFLLLAFQRRILQYT